MPRPLSLCVLLVLIAALSTACGPSESAHRGLVVINPATPERPFYYDFDVVPEGEVREHTYVLENTDPGPLTITKIQSSCGCTVPRVTAIDPDGTRTAGRVHTDGGQDIVTVPEGGQLEVTVTTDTRSVRVKNQHKLNTVLLTCDSENEPFLRFEQHLWVALAFNATPLEINLEQVPEGGGRTGATELFPALPGSAARVTGVHSATPGLTVNFNEEPRPLGNVTIVTAELAPGMPRGPWLGEVRLDCTLADGETPAPPFLIPVRGQVTTDVVSSPANLILHARANAGPAAESLVQALIPGERVKLTGHRIVGDSAGVEVSYEPMDLDSSGRSVRWRLEVTVAPEQVGETRRGVVELDTDIESVSTLRIPFTVAQSATGS